MSDVDRRSATNSQAEEASAADAESRGAESWIDRLRAVVGLKGPASIREDLAEALATEDVGGGFSPEERTMLSNILRLREVRVDDVMIPRADIEAVDVSIRLDELLAMFRKSGHSRLPVYRDSLDDPVGLVHIKDLMVHVAGAALVSAPPAVEGEPAPVETLDLCQVDLKRPLAESGLVREILFVPPSMPIAVLLASMQASRMQMALVIDEYGGTDGLVSLEDAVEVIVGDIEDETDEDTGPMILPDGKGGFLADARADIDEVREAIGEDLAINEDGERIEDVDTVGGLVFSLTGRIPVRGELIVAPAGYEFEILEADPRRIRRLRITRLPEEKRARLQKNAGTDGSAGENGAAGA